MPDTDVLKANPAKLEVFLGTRPYLVIATRGDAKLGFFASAPLVTPDKTTSIFFAFAVIGPAEEINHFTARGNSLYRLQNGGVVQGQRLNKVLIPVFDKPVPVLHFSGIAKQLGIFAELGKWVQAQVTAEGFTPLVFSFTELLENMYSVEAAPEGVQSILALPDFEEPEQEIVEASDPDENDFDADDADSDEEDGYDEDEDEEEEDEEEEDEDEEAETSL